MINFIYVYIFLNTLIHINFFRKWKGGICSQGGEASPKFPEQKNLSCAAGCYEH